MGNQLTVETAQCDAIAPEVTQRHFSPLMKTALMTSKTAETSTVTAGKDITALDFCVLSGW